MEEKVSIIVPVYNVEDYLSQCLNSIINQTYKNIEVIIVNDGSTDNSSNIIEKFKIFNNNIIVINQKNGGLSVARNVGLSYATGKYILYVDSDDYLELECVEKIVNKIIKDKSEMVIFNYSKIYDSGINGENNIVSIGLDENKIYTGSEIAELMLKNLIQGYVCFRLFKRENLTKNNFIFEVDRKVEDFFPMFKETCNSNNISYIERHLYNYRQRQGSTVNTINYKLMTDYIYAMELTATYAEKKNFNRVLIERFKLIKSCIIIKNYYLFNKDSKKIYKEFSDNKLDKCLPNISFKIINKYNLKSVLLIIAWRLRIYDKIMKLKIISN